MNFLTSCVHRRQDDHSLTISESEWLRRHLLLLFFFFFWLNDLNIYKDGSYKMKLVSATLNFMPKKTKKLGTLAKHTQFPKHPYGLACGLITHV